MYTDRPWYMAPDIITIHGTGLTIIRGPVTYGFSMHYNPWTELEHGTNSLSAAAGQRPAAAGPAQRPAASASGPAFGGGLGRPSSAGQPASGRPFGLTRPAFGLRPAAAGMARLQRRLAARRIGQPAGHWPGLRPSAAFGHRRRRAIGSSHSTSFIRPVVIHSFIHSSALNRRSSSSISSFDNRVHSGGYSLLLSGIR